MNFRSLITVLFGIVGPIVCVIFDPMVFRFDLADAPLGFSSAYLEAYQPFAYAAIVLSCVLPIIHLARVSFRPEVCVAIAGGLLASAVFAFALGVVLLPYSIIGIIIFIGILGLTPFITSWIYALAGFAEYRRASPVSKGPLFALAGATSFFAIAGVFQVTVDHSMNQALEALSSPNAELRIASTATIRRWDYLFGHQRLIAEYSRSRSESNRRALAEAYQTLTQRDLESDFQIAND